MGAPRAPHRDAVLDAWSSRPDASATAIGAVLGLSRKAVYCCVSTARAEGDHRAVVRGKGYQASQPPRGDA